MFNIEVTNNIPSSDRILKYLRNGISTGLTRTAKEGQAAVQTAAETDFINRKKWYAASSPIGIRITPATGESLEAAVRSTAYFGELQDKGGIKLPYSSTHLAIPAKGGPLAGRRSIPDDLKPKALIRSGKAFIEITEKGTQLLVVHGLRDAGRYRGTVLMYVLVPKAKIRPTHFFYDSVQKVADTRLQPNVARGIDESLARLRSRL